MWQVKYILLLNFLLLRLIPGDAVDVEDLGLAVLVSEGEAAHEHLLEAAVQGVEVERKFLVDDVDAALAGAEPGLHLVQGYLEQTGDQSVRIRCWATTAGRCSP